VNDDAIRSALRPLRDADVPPVPAMGVRAPESPRPSRLPALAAAAALLAILAGVLFSRPAPPSPHPLAARLAAAEAKIEAIEHPELRALLRREVELLRRELRLSAGAP
jgi:hypothetical protein